MIEKFKNLHTVNLSYKELEAKIRERNLTDYVVESIKGISERVGAHSEERTFDGLSLEALFGEQIEKCGVKTLHNSSPTIFWYDLEFPDDNYFMDVKKHTSASHQSSWLSIYNSTLNPGGQLFHLRHNGKLEKLYILFVNTRYVKHTDDHTDVIMKISPSWIVRADAFFEGLKVSQTPEMSYFNHREFTPDLDYIKFTF